jgi:hypothetical protein
MTWRPGTKLGRTLYRDEVCVGMVDTPEIAVDLVDAINAVAGGRSFWDHVDSGHPAIEREKQTAAKLGAANVLLREWHSLEPDDEDPARSLYARTATFLANQPAAPARTDREEALVQAASTLLHRHSGADGDDTDEQIDEAFDALGDALDPYVRSDLGLAAAPTRAEAVPGEDPDPPDVFCPQCGLSSVEDDADGHAVSPIEEDGGCRFCGSDTVTWSGLLEHLLARGYELARRKLEP